VAGRLPSDNSLMHVTMTVLSSYPRHLHDTIQGGKTISGPHTPDTAGAKT
jgi:hypothetical protein